MNSNGYGRWQQKIKVRVSKTHAEAVAEKLATRAQNNDKDTGRSLFIWRRDSFQKGNDEDVVIELWGLLGELALTSDWDIDWEASDH